MGADPAGANDDDGLIVSCWPLGRLGSAMSPAPGSLPTPLAGLSTWLVAGLEAEEKGNVAVEAGGGAKNPGDGCNPPSWTSPGDITCPGMRSCPVKSSFCKRSRTAAKTRWCKAWPSRKRTSILVG